MYKYIKKLLILVIISLIVINGVFSIIEDRFDLAMNKQVDGCYNATVLSEINACDFIVQNNPRFDKSSSYKIFVNYIVLLFILCFISAFLIKKQSKSYFEVVVIPCSILETTLNYIHSIDGQKGF